MTLLRLDYPQLTESLGCGPIYEQVRAVTVSSGAAELTSHTVYIPLSPGDLVTVDSDANVTRIEHLEPPFTYDADFAVPANLVFGQALPPDDLARRLIAKTAEEWRRDAWVTQHTGLSFYVSSQSEQWIEDRVRRNPYVDFIQIVRFPGMPIDFEVAVANADLGDLTVGPWV